MGLSFLLVFGMCLLGAGSASAADPVSITIGSTTSPLSVYTGNPAEGIPNWTYPTTDISVTVTRPADGFYTRSYSLVQDGYAASWYFGGLGAGDWSCTGAPQDMGMSFYQIDHPLHPGSATATVYLYDNSTGDLAGTATRNVTIPESLPTAPLNPARGMTSTSSATLTWKPPVIAGGTITGYRVSRDGGTAGASGWSTTVSAATRSLSFTNPLAGRTYTLTVAAINAHGTGPSASATVVPGTPGLPSKTAAKSNTTSAALTWATPVTPGRPRHRISRQPRRGHLGCEPVVDPRVGNDSVLHAHPAVDLGHLHVLSGSHNAKGAGSSTNVKR